jgi:type II secretory pathway pseudopilin PulG
MTGGSRRKAARAAERAGGVGAAVGAVQGRLLRAKRRSRRAPRHAPRMPFALLVTVLVLGAMALLLGLNTLSAANEVRRHAFATRDEAVGAQVEQLRIDVNDSAAPANLASAAAALGMVPAGNPAFIVDVAGRLIVRGKPLPAPYPVVPPPTTSAARTTPAATTTTTTTTTPAKQPAKTTPTSTSKSPKSPSKSRSTSPSTSASTSPSTSRSARPTPTPTPTVTLPGGPR